MSTRMIHQHEPILIVLLILSGYLLGSVSSAILLSRCFNLPDPRSYGSKNPGTTNVFRAAGKHVAALVLIADLLKGFLIIFASKSLGMPNRITAIAAIAVFIGHLFPLFFNFVGGKGIAVTLGILLALNIKLALIALLTWIAIFAIFRISSLAGLIATIHTMILASLTFYLKLEHWIAPEFSLCIIFLGLLIILKHKNNIYNLISGKESKINHNKIK